MGSGSITYLPSHRSRHLARALAAWREAPELVRLRWDGFRRSEAPTRAFAFGSYLAALDAEEAAAAEMARLWPGVAAPRAAA